MCVHEFIDMETGEILYVEMTDEQFMQWLSDFVENLDMCDLEEKDEK